MYDALLGYNYTSFKISFKLYSEHIHKIYTGYVYLKAFFFSKKEKLYLAF